MHGGSDPLYTTELLSFGDNPTGDWVDAFDIQVAEDNWENAHSPAAHTLVDLNGM